jgi:hypothetical protein
LNAASEFPDSWLAGSAKRPGFLLARLKVDRVMYVASPWEEEMFSRSSVTSILSGLLMSTALAQQPQAAKPGVKVPACSQAMIVRTWQAAFTSVAPLNFRVFACPITIAANGAVSPGNCTTPDAGMTVTPPSGTLTIDSVCHVTGAINYAVVEKGSSYSSYSALISVSLWRSTDGSRLSGFQQWTVRGSSYLFPFDLTASP